MIHWSPAWNSRCRPRPTQPIFKQLPPKVEPLRQARVRSGKNLPPWTKTPGTRSRRPQSNTYPVFSLGAPCTGRARHCHARVSVRRGVSPSAAGAIRTIRALGKREKPGDPASTGSPGSSLPAYDGASSLAPPRPRSPRPRRPRDPAARSRSAAGGTRASAPRCRAPRTPALLPRP